MKDAFGVEVSKAMFPGAAARVIPKALQKIKPSPLIASKVRPPTPGIKPMKPMSTARYLRWLQLHMNWQDARNSLAYYNPKDVNNCRGIIYWNP